MSKKKRERLRSSQREPVEGAAPCPKCHRPMQRYQHPPAWKPKPGQPYHFAYWDRCKPCGHMQMYEAAKVYASPAEEARFEQYRSQRPARERYPDEPVEQALDRQQLDMLAETGRAEVPYKRPSPDPIVISRSVYVRRTQT